MSPDLERLRRIDELFDHVLDLSPTERQDFLASDEVDDELAVEVKKLLELADQQDSRVKSGAAMGREALVDFFEGEQTDQALGEGDMVGAYRILSEIGRGGMGVVYRAERADEAFNDVVAIKVIKRGADTDEVVRRFRQERQILACLRNPHVANLLDGGSTADGRPFLVMEFVEGKRLDEACALWSLDLDERLGLFQQVIEAVVHAHQNLVVHRDLKPSNILVNDARQVKLLDFGIAKLLDQGAPEMTFGDAAAMTPAYASPEQISAQPITTASDVYQLGLLLYELITGVRFRQNSAEGDTSFRLPARVSDVVMKSRERIEALAGDHGARWLSQRLRGDLDTIVLKALQPEPYRRYRSAFELAEDMRRFFACMPITARPDSLAYRTSKFIRRYRFAVVSAAVVALTLVAYAVTVTWQAKRIIKERDRAQVAAESLAQVRDFLIDVFQGADPNEALGEDVTARELLESSAQRLETALEGQPVVKAEMLTAVGEIKTRLGLYDDAEALLRQSLELAGEVHSSGDVTLPRALEALGVLYLRQARWGEARELFERRLEIVQESAGSAWRLREARALADLGRVAREQGDFARAEHLLSRSSTIIDAWIGPESVEKARLLNDLGLTAWERKELGLAKTRFERALHLFRTYLRADHPFLTATLANLGLVHTDLGHYAQAESALREALESREKVLGSDHVMIATTLRNLGRTLYEQQRLDEALEVYERALEIRRRVLGSDHLRNGALLSDLGHIAGLQGDLVKAEKFFRAAIESYPLGNRWRNIPRMHLSNLFRERGDLNAAEATARAGLAEDRQHLGERSEAVALDLTQLARVLNESGDLAEGLTAAREALSIYQEVSGENAISHEATRILIGRLLIGLGEPEEAEPLLRGALAARSERFGAEDERTQEVLELLRQLEPR